MMESPTEDASTKELMGEGLLRQVQKELEESRRERKELMELIRTLTAPKKARPRSPRHEATSKIIEIVRTKGYATCRDAELLGLGNTDWQRCLADIKTMEPTWTISIVKHTKFLHRPDFDLKTVEATTFTIGNLTATDPKILQHLINEVRRTGRLNVLAYLQDKAAERGDDWRDQVLDALDSFGRKLNSGIEREYNEIGGIRKRSDWFKKRS